MNINSVEPVLLIVFLLHPISAFSADAKKRGNSPNAVKISGETAAPRLKNENTLIKGVNLFKEGKYQEALGYLTPLADKGSAEAQLLTGVIYEKGLGVKQNYGEAFKLYSLSAGKGFVQAQFNLGMMYSEGMGISSDSAKAAEWFRKAADQGHTQAEVNLGVMYEDGKGVRQDYLEAFSWYEKAAYQNDGGAQFNLGLIYYSGKGVPQDYASAYAWFSLAASQGNKAVSVRAREMMAGLEGKMTKEQVAEAQKIAREAWGKIQKK